MSLREILVPYLRVPKQLGKIEEEINKVMSKVIELQDAVDEMRQAVANEASELWAQVDELRTQIDARVDPSSLDSVIESIRGTISNIDAISEGRPVVSPEEPAPEVPVDEEPTFPIEPDVPADGSDEEPAF